jgi:chitodextrinase
MKSLFAKADGSMNNSIAPRRMRGLLSVWVVALFGCLAFAKSAFAAIALVGRQRKHIAVVQARGARSLELRILCFQQRVGRFVDEAVWFFRGISKMECSETDRAAKRKYPLACSLKEYARSKVTTPPDPKLFWRMQTILDRFGRRSVFPLCAALFIFGFNQPSLAAIAYVQSNWSTPAAGVTTTVPYNSAQTAGNLNVVIVSWNDPTATLISISDTKGNTYIKAIGPTIAAGSETQYIYYAKNIIAAAAGANTVTVVASTNVSYPDIRIAEYSGIDTVNPLDGAVGASGVGASMDSGFLTTTNANDLLVAGNELEFSTLGFGSNYTQRLYTSDSSILIDQVVTSTGNYNATATQQSGWWVMQMAAFRAASGGGGDTQPPSIPANLGLTLVNSTQLDLSWAPSTDNVGVTGYEVQRCQGASCTNFVTVGTPTSASFSSTGLLPLTTYRFQVRARDAVPNWSNYSAIFTATTSEGQPPTVPTGLTTTLINSTQINLSWTASTDNVGVTGYEVQSCQVASCTNFATVGTPATNSLNMTGLTALTTYRFQVRARDAVPNWSNYSTIFNVSTPEGQPPSVPTGLTTTLVNSTQINLSWAASTDNVGVTGYEVQRCQGASCTNFASVGTPATNSLNMTGLTALTTYRFQVRARDAVPNWSNYSTIFNVTTTEGQAPTVPTGLTTTLIGSSQINLSWTPSTDNVGVTGYEVQRCQGAGCTTFVSVGTPSSASFNDTGLSSSTTYRYQVRAQDAVPNWSAYSTILTAATTVGLAAPTGLSVTAFSNKEIDLVWNAVSGAANYVVERCSGAGCNTFAQVGAATPSLFIYDAGLTANTSYSYRVKAVDSGGQQGTASSVVTRATLQTQSCD